MKDILSNFGVMLLCFCVTLYGAALNAGMSSGSGYMEMVICSEEGTQTITIDAAGNPVSPAGQCCDCLACNAPTTDHVTTTFQAPAGTSHYGALVVPAQAQTLHPILIARPQVRGPPPASLETGVRAAPFCGLVCKDTIV